MLALTFDETVHILQVSYFGSDPQRAMFGVTLKHAEPRGDVERIGILHSFVVHLAADDVHGVWLLCIHCLEIEGDARETVDSNGLTCFSWQDNALVPSKDCATVL